MSRRAEKRAKRSATRPADPIRRTLLAGIAAVLLVLSGTAEERTFGTISDEQQMLGTAVSMAELGEIGIARGQLFTVHRPAGDAVSPYGMGLSLLEVVPALFAASFERAFGAGSSQTLFVGCQILLVALAGAGAAGLALLLGAGRMGLLAALLGTALGSPLWAYPASNYSEPLQAAALVLAVLAARRAASAAVPSRRELGLSATAGAFSGVAVLAKSLNLLLIPLLLAPLLLDGMGDRRARARLLAASAAGVTLPLALWLGFEIARFGRPFASYGGTGFTHPLLDGLWRLLVGPGKGLLLYFPLLALSVAGLAVLARRRSDRGSALAIAGSSLVVLLVSSAWWAWDGTVGWGPRLLVPLVPLLAAAAGVPVPERGPVRGLFACLLLAGLLVNSLGVFQTEAATAAFVSSAPPITLSDAEARRYPAHFLRRDAEGRCLLDRQFVAARDVALSPLRVHAFLLGARFAARDTADLERRLASPPWLASRPDLVPRIEGPEHAVQALVHYLRSPFRWPHLGSAMGRLTEAEAQTFNRAWNDAQVDQILRALDTGRADRALALSERLFLLTPSGYAAALHAESLRALRRPEALEQFLRSLPREFFASPSLGVVEALAARDRGDEPAAREILRQVAHVFPRPGILRAVEGPVSDWPQGLHGMTGENLTDRKLQLPSLGGPGR